MASGDFLRAKSRVWVRFVGKVQLNDKLCHVMCKLGAGIRIMRGVICLTTSCTVKARATI
mgnify:CR=1 FL=1